MADIRVNAATNSIARAGSSNNLITVRGMRDGSIVTAPFYEALTIEGRGFVANMGSVTTPLTFLVTAANRPDAWIRVPSGTTILPLFANVTLESMAGADTEIDVRIAQNDIGNGTSSAASVGPLNLRTDAPISSNCTARQLATGDTTAETNPVSIYRRTFSQAEGTAVDPAPFSIEITRDMMSYPVVVGPSTWELFIAATTTQATGFVVLTWIELATATSVTG